MRPSYARKVPRAWRRTASMFVALGDEHRQRILLMFEPGERLTVGQIVAASTLSRSAVAHHLKVLREAGVLRSEKIGKEVWFWIDRQWLLSVFGNVIEYIAETT